MHHSDFPRLQHGSHLTDFGTGSPTLAPISWSMIPISDVMDVKYWRVMGDLTDSGICKEINLTAWKANLQRALGEYATSISGETPTSRKY